MKDKNPDSVLPVTTAYRQFIEESIDACPSSHELGYKCERTPKGRALEDRDPSSMQHAPGSGDGMGNVVSLRPVHTLDKRALFPKQLRMVKALMP